jgi:hypothetical protein
MIEVDVPGTRSSVISCGIRFSRSATFVINAALSFREVAVCWLFEHPNKPESEAAVTPEEFSSDPRHVHRLSPSNRGVKPS